MTIRIPHIRSALVTGGAILIALGLTPPVRAQQAPAPSAVQWAMLSRVLSFERNLVAADREIVIGLVYQDRVRESKTSMEEMMALVRASAEVGGVRYRGVAIEVRELGADPVGSHDAVDALYITPVRAIAMEAITAVSQKRRELTLTGVPEFVDDGLAVGIDLHGQKPRILINLKAARAEGADFEARLLKLAKIVD